MKKISTTVTVVMLGASLLTLVSCGGKKSSSPVISQQTKEPSTDPVVEEPEVEEEVEVKPETDQGQYQAKLLPLNSVISGDPSGTFTVTIKGDKVKFEAEVFGVSSGIKHYQTIHTGSVCPDENLADKNFDGIVDIVEGLASYGHSLLPVDGNLRTQIEGMNYGPIANEEGYYHYLRTVPFSVLMSDLTADDNDAEDHLAKLAPQQKLRLKNKIVVIYGVSEQVDIPQTARTIEGIPTHEALPVACGKFELVQ